MAIRSGALLAGSLLLPVLAGCSVVSRGIHELSDADPRVVAAH
jgi:hypothetical protein